MFSNAGFPIASDQVIPDTLIDNLVVSGNETTIARLTELLGTGVDELMISLVPIMGTSEDEQQAQLMHLIGRL